MSERAPTPEELRATARAEIERGDTEDGSGYLTAVAPAYVAALVDRIEALADRIGQRSLDYMDDGYAFEAETLGVVEGEIRAALRKPLDTEDDDA